jgi:rare lipoprotein A
MKTPVSLLAVAAAVCLLPGHSASARISKVAPPSAPETQSFVQSGIASWYGSGFIGGKTANGEIYRSGDRTAAHKTLPFNTLVRVTDKRSGRSTVVRINNRGPFIKGRIIDLSLVAAKEIGLTSKGVAPVSIEVLGKGNAAVAEQRARSKEAAPQKEQKVVSIGRRSIYDNPLFN